MFPSYLSGNDTKNRGEKKDSLSRCKTPTPCELFTLLWSDFTPGWGGDR